MDHLEQQRLAAREAEPLEVEGGRAGLQLERRGHGLAGGLGPRRDQPGLGVQAAALHLLGEAH